MEYYLTSHREWFCLDLGLDDFMLRLARSSRKGLGELDALDLLLDQYRRLGTTSMSTVALLTLRNYRDDILTKGYEKHIDILFLGSLISKWLEHDQ